MAQTIGTLILAIAALIACGKFCLEFCACADRLVVRLEVPVRLRDPGIGTFLVLASFAFLKQSALVWAAVIATCLIDTAGLPWFFVMIVWMAIREKRRIRRDGKTGTSDPGKTDVK